MTENLSHELSLLASRKKRAFGVFAILWPLLAGTLLLFGSAVYEFATRGHWLVTNSKLIDDGSSFSLIGAFLVLVWGSAISFAYWGVPAVVCGAVFTNALPSRRKIPYGKVLVFASIATVVYTALGCSIVYMLISDKVSTKYAIEHSWSIFKFSVPASAIAAFVCCWIVNTFVLDPSK